METDRPIVIRIYQYTGAGWFPIGVAYSQNHLQTLLQLYRQWDNYNSETETSPDERTNHSGFPEH